MEQDSLSWIGRPSRRTDDPEQRETRAQTLVEHAQEQSLRQRNEAAVRRIEQLVIYPLIYLLLSALRI